MNQLMTQGQALSTWSFSGSQDNVNTLLFEDTKDPRALRPVRVQGLVWSGDAVLTLRDAANTLLFTGPSTDGLWPPTISGSCGLTCNAPLRMTVVGGIGEGGYLTIYGEVL